ncbi:protein Abitram-like [Saccoglossus kowalevskii]|uniref:Protein Abitram n=1 Tax=Saccoglossus kowalevskii TaxID=10224 RepID=A0ABM0GQ26_SACKO|nr:PREDICTED: protein FAM206A-like [Saccoglossus kowalevskii]
MAACSISTEQESKSMCKASPKSDRILKCSYPSVVDRYFRRGYKIDVNGRPGEDLCILQHSNKVIIVTIADSHPLIKNNKTIKNVTFQVTKNLNRMDNKVSGKGKKGGQWVNETGPLCIITCDDDSQYTIYSCVNGKLVEVNEKLLSVPNLINEKPSTDGFISIILPKFGNSDPQMEKLLTKDEYEKEILNRAQEDKNS